MLSRVKTYDVRRLYEMDYSLEKVNALNQQWQEGQSYEMPKSGRPDNGLMLIIDCRDRMTVGDTDIIAEPGQVVYLPKGSRYSAVFTETPNKGSHVKKVTDRLVNFILRDESGEEFVLSDSITVFTPENSGEISELFSAFSDHAGYAAFPPALYKAKLYELLTLLCREAREAREPVSGRKTLPELYTVMNYISENCLKTAIHVPELAAMCHVSEATFRRMFAKHCGMSPTEYINSLRIRRALVLLRDGSLDVAETAREVGFEDASYFSRFFKAHTGKSPTEASGKRKEMP